MKKFILSVTFLLACSAGSVWAQSAVKTEGVQVIEPVEAAKPARLDAKQSAGSASSSEVKETGVSKPAAKSCCANKAAGSASCSKDKKDAADMSCDKSKKAAGKSSCCQKGGHSDAKADAPHDHSKN